MEMIERQKKCLESLETESGVFERMGQERLIFLAQLPILLNSSLDERQVIAIALEYLQDMVGAEAATVFTLSSNRKELLFWALKGGEKSRLEGKKMPADAGIVGWVIKNKRSLIVDDARSDPRFFSEIDKEGSFVTRNVLCAPLLVRGQRIIGAIQALNKSNGDGFVETDLQFIEQFSHQVALAIDNANLYNEAQTKSQQLAVLDRSKNDLISIISHEFRTPLNLIQNASEILLSEAVDKNDRHHITKALACSVKRLDDLVEQTGNIAGLNEGVVKVNAKEFEVSNMVRRVVGEFKLPSKKRKIKLKTEIGPGVKMVKADQILLLVVMKNLISNAIRFTPDGGEIIVGIRRMSGLLEFSVRDTGIGISKEEIPCIFEKFYEVGDLLQHSSGDFEFKSAGLGLGLATARTIVEAHGSSIDVVSDIGQGSKFSFCLPCQ